MQRLARTRDVTTSAAIWDAKGGVHLVSDYLSTANLSGWTLTSATSISDDGKVVVGNGLRTASIKVGSRTFLELGSDATLATALQYLLHSRWLTFERGRFARAAASGVRNGIGRRNSLCALGRAGLHSSKSWCAGRV